jgi:hypothetical protein
MHAFEAARLARSHSWAIIHHPKSAGRPEILMKNIILAVAAGVALVYPLAAESEGRIELDSPSGKQVFALPRAETRQKVIVQFDRTPAVLQADRKFSSRPAELFDRFRSDLAALDRASSAKGGGRSAPKLEREYWRLFSGAALEADEATVAAIRKLPYVRDVQPDFTVTSYSSSSQAVVDARPGVNAANLGHSGRGVRVAIIDTGIDYLHPALGGGFGPGFKVAGGYDFVNNDNDPMDDQGHGTHVAGTVAANSPDLIGVAPEATLFAYKVLAASGSGSSSSIIAAIERAADPDEDGDLSDRLDVVNLSLGGPEPFDGFMSQTVAAAVQAGIVVVVAAGNDGGIATIGSPGTAPAALTVGAIDDGGNVTWFSSRGPTRSLATLKPEVVAPGFQIVSARLGGGTFAASGTSMATPHVAGLAALLRGLHPAWSAAEIKGAIVSGTTPIVGEAFVRGAGRADGARATLARIVTTPSGISFGLNHATEGAFEQSRTVTFRNFSAINDRISLDTSRFPAGVLVTATPSSFDLPAGASQDVTLRLNVDNTAFGFPSGLLTGGDVLVTAGQSSRLPVGFVRAARATVRFDAAAWVAIATSEKRPSYTIARSAEQVEMLMEPGGAWDFIISADVPPEEPGKLRDVVRTVVIEKRPVSGDVVVEASVADATVELVLDGRDEAGTPLHSLPQVAGVAQRSGVIRKVLSDGDSNFAYSIFMPNPRKIYLSPLSSRYTLFVSEHLADLSRMKAYNVHYRPLNSVMGPQPLVPTSDYLRANFSIPTVGPESSQLSACNWSGLAFASFWMWTVTDCFTRSVDPGGTLEYFTTEDTSSTHGGLFVRSREKWSTLAARGVEGRIRLSEERVSSPWAASVRNGAEVPLAQAQVFPFAFPGTTGGAYFGSPLPGFKGALGEVIGWDQSSWAEFDERGSIIAGGLFPATSPPATPTLRRRLTAEKRGLTVGGVASNGFLEVQFGADASDLVPPTLTSFHVENSAGAIAGRLTAGQAATLRFSAADVEYMPSFSTKASKPESTRAWYRIGGSGEWRPLQLNAAGKETGSRTSLGHFPAGDIYSADLTPATVLAGTQVDVRVEIEDAAGNRLTWIQEPAVVVGGSSEPQRRRPAR